MSPRLNCGVAGVILLALAPLIVKWSILDVLAKAEAGAADLSYSDKAFFAIPMALLAGPAALIMAAMPSLWVGYPRPRKRFSEQSLGYQVGVIALVVFMLGAGFALRA